MKKIGFLISLFVALCIATVKAAYVDEYSEAYTWAYKNGITTMDTIDKANMNGEITRIALAKMISNYAINVLKRNPDTSKKCEFSDISDKLNSQYDSGVTKSCQLGLMGQGITKFRPNDKVTRAEFGTILSRLLWGNKYNGGSPYYKKHINQLNVRGIMTNINNLEKGMELRGNVMVMLKRSETLGNISIPSFKELDDVINDKCPSDFEGMNETVKKKGFIIPYKNGYIGFDYGGNSGFLGYYLTYKSLDNPCENISITDEIFIRNASYKYLRDKYNDYEYPDNKLYISDGGGSPIDNVVIKNLNCKEGQGNPTNDVCMKEIDRFMYDLIIGEEEQEYFTKWINRFKKDIDNNKFTNFEFWNNMRRNCYDKTDSGEKCINEYLKN